MRAAVRLLLAKKTLTERIRALFAHSEQGLWYDPSDFSTLFQDSTGTTPLTAVEQPVGLMLDKSGRGYHASQATSTKRPVLKQDASGRYYLLFDGVDDALATGSIDFSATDKMTVVAGVRKLSDAAVNALMGTGINYTAAGCFEFFSPGAAAAADYRVGLGGTAGSGLIKIQSFAAPITNVLTVQLDIGGSPISDGIKIRANATSPASSVVLAGPAGSGNFSNNPLYIGSRTGTSLPFNGHLYSLIIRGAQSSDSQIAAAESYVNGKTGAY